MTNIKLTKKDIKTITESCIKNMLKEGYFDSNQPDKHQSKSPSQTKLDYIVSKIGGTVDNDGIRFFVEDEPSNVEVVLLDNRGQLSIENLTVSTMGKIGNIPEAINAHKWAAQFLTLFSQSNQQTQR